MFSLNLQAVPLSCCSNGCIAPAYCQAFCGGAPGSTVTTSDPLILDLDGDGVAVRNQAKSKVFFDMDSTGTVNHVSWIDPADAFLARDLNGNGKIDDARELFSSTTDSITRSGFEALARLDDNGDDVIDAADDVFETLLVWRDRNIDGQTQPGELAHITSYNITALPLIKIVVPDATLGGDLLFGGAACAMSSAHAGPNVTFVFEVGLVTLTDPEYLKGRDLPGAIRQYFGKDASKLLVLDTNTSVDLGNVKPRAIFGSSQDDYFDASAAGVSPVFIRGAEGDDVLIGGDRPDMLSGEEGADHLDGGGGNDILWIDGDDTFVQGGEGFDVVIVEGIKSVTIDMFEAGIEVLYCGPGDDVITMSGGDYAVRVRADVGNDNVTLSGGDDFISAGPGNDTVDGGGGKDTVEFTGNMDEYSIDVVVVNDVTVVTVTDTVDDRDGVGANDGITVMSNIEKLTFADQTRSLDGRNTAPVIPAPDIRLVRSTAPVTFFPSELIAMAIEFDGESMSLAGVGAATNGAVTFLENGQIIFAAADGFVGRASFEFTVQDPNGSKTAGIIRFDVLPPLPVDELYSTQWHHDNIRSVAIWDTGITGAGVKVRVNDDMLQMDHPDLVDQLDAVNSYDFANDDPDPSPTPEDSEDNHGTFVTGLIVASRNSIGIVGVAYNAVVRFGSGFFHGPVDDADVVNLSFGYKPAFGTSPTKTYNSIGTIFGPDGYASGRTEDERAFKYELAARSGRGGLGTVILASSSNHRLAFHRSDGMRIQNSRHTMSIASHTEANRISYFSSMGACVHVSCPGSDITSTDRTGDVGYSQIEDFLTIGLDNANGQGTSYSSPICAGIAALMVEARPDLGWRDVSEIIGYTALTDAVEATGLYQFEVNGARHQPLNGGGLKSSEDWGFGAADAYGAVRLAQTWIITPTSPARTSANEVEVSATLTPNRLIPDNGELNHSIVLTTAQPHRVMHVEVGLRIVHPRIGDLTVLITSPSGTSGTLVRRHLLQDESDENDLGAQSANIFYRFSSMRQWGEPTQGTWTLTIRDSATGDIGTLEYCDLRVFGDFVPADSLYVFTDDFGRGVTASGFDTLHDVDGGNDTINVSPVRDSVIVDLKPGSQRSVIRGATLRIGADTLIENAFCGDGDDTVVGNDAENVIRTGRGDDTLKGSPGADVMDGGDGDDTADYAESDAAISVSLVEGNTIASGGHAEGDVLVAIERIVGSSFGDTLRGSAGDNVLSGGEGADTIFGGQGDDLIRGGFGNDDLHGEDGDDVIHPGFGVNDRVDCGAGSDIVVMLGHSTDYTVTYSGDSVTVTDGVNTAVVQGCEFIQYTNRRELLSATVNRPPHVQTALQFATPEDTPVRIELAEIAAAIDDPDQDTIELVFINGATNGNVTLDGTGLVFSPNAFFNGIGTVSCTVTDNRGNFLAVTLAFDVTPVNSQPLCPGSKLSLPESQGNAAVAGSVRAFDVDGDALVYIIEAGPTVGQVAMNADGTFEYDLSGVQLGAGRLAGLELQATYRATDQGGLTCTGRLDIQITGLVRVFSAGGRSFFLLNVTDGNQTSEQYSTDYARSRMGNDTTASFVHQVELGGPKVAFLSTGELVYTWAAVGVDGSGTGVAAQLFDSQGNRIGKQFTVNTYTESDQAVPVPIALSSGDFLIAWVSRGQDASSKGIYFQRFDRLGFTIGEETRANDETTSTQSGPAAVALPRGGFVIAWHSFGQDGDSFGVFARVFDRFGGARNTELQVNTEIESFQQVPSLAVLPSGTWLTIWEGAEADGSYGIFGRLFLEEDPRGDQFRINIGSEGSQFNPVCAAVAASPAYPDGSFVVMFSDADQNPAPANRMDITGVHVSADGTVIGSEIRINRQYTRGNQYARQIVPLPDGFGGAGDGGMHTIWEGFGVTGQLLTNGLGFVGNELNFAIPRFSNGSFMPNAFTMRPSGAATPLNGGTFALAYQENNFEARTTQMRLRFRKNRATFETTAPLTLVGGPGADTLYGDEKEDIFFGDAGNDTFIGKQGTSGNDRVIYRSPRLRHNLAQLAPHLWTVTSIDSGDVDLLDGIEKIEFANAVIRINSLPVAVNDVMNPLLGSFPILDNDRDTEDGTILPASATIVTTPRYGRATFNASTGRLAVGFAPGDTLGFSDMTYMVVDSAGLTAQAVVRVRFDCADVPGTSVAEEIVTGSLADAAACGNNFTLTGNGGTDVFTVAKRPGGTDIITDFGLEDDADQIGLSGFTSIKTFAQVILAARQVGDDTVFDLEGVHIVILRGVQLSHLRAEHFAGKLGRGLLVVNTFPRIAGANGRRTSQIAVDTLTAAETNARGTVRLDRLLINPTTTAQTLVVWESYPADFFDGSAAQDGSEYGLFGQFLDANGTKRGVEFQVATTTARSQYRPVIVRQATRHWFWVLWTQSYRDDENRLGTEFMGNAIMYNGEAVCTFNSGVTQSCTENSRGVLGPDLSMMGRISGQWLHPFGVETRGDGTRGESVLTYGAFVRTPEYCCTLYVRSYATRGQSTLYRGLRRIDSSDDGTVLSHANNRAAMAALTFDARVDNVGDQTGSFVGQLVVIGWLRTVRVPARSQHDPPRSTVLTAYVLTLRLLNSLSGDALQTVPAVQETGYTISSPYQWHSHLTAFKIVQLANGIAQNDSIDAFGQFAVVHGFRQSGTLGSHEFSERIAISVFTRVPGNAIDCSAGCPGYRHHAHTLHSRHFVTSVDFTSNGRRRLADLGLSACVVAGDGGTDNIAVVFGHKFAFAETPVILVQLFDLAGEALGPFVVVSGYTSDQSGSSGVSVAPHNPQISPGVDGSSVVVVWSQSVVPLSNATAPNTNINSKLIALSSLVQPVPYCADDQLRADEDTAFEISLDDILANDGDSARDGLTVVALNVVPEQSELVTKANGSIVPTTGAGATVRRRTTVRRSGLRAVYFPADEALPHLRVRDASAPYRDPSTPVTPSPTSPGVAFATVVGELSCGRTLSGNTTGAANNVGSASGEHVYRLTVTADMQHSYSFSTCNGTDYDSRIRLYTASGIELVSNDDFCGVRSQIDRRLTSGVYMLVVEGYSANEGGYTLRTACHTGPLPLGRDFERIDFDRTPNPFSFPPDVISKRTTFEQPDGSRNSWPGVPRYMTSNFYADVSGSFTLDRDEDRVQFLVTASSAAALWVDGKLVQVSRDRRPYNDTIGALSPPPPPPPPPGSQCCGSVMVSRFAQHQPAYIGLYTVLDGVIVNDRTVYSNNEVSPKYIYYSGRFWLMGTDYNGRVGHLYASSDVTCPSDVPAWFVFHDGIWNRDLVSVSCDGCCETVEMFGDEQPYMRNLMTTYRKLPGVARSRRPVYRRSLSAARYRGEKYLFFSGSNWIVGNDIDGNGGSIYTPNKEVRKSACYLGGFPPIIASTMLGASDAIARSYLSFALTRMLGSLVRTASKSPPCAGLPGPQPRG